LKILWKDGVPPPFGPPIYVIRGGLWAKHMGLKRGVIGNTFGEHIGNIWRTHWELERNMLGTKEKGEKKYPLPPKT
jgi:hypothetical protein